MRRVNHDSFGYHNSYGDTSSRHNGARRNINQQINVGNLDSMISSSHVDENGRSSLNDASDYNIDVTESQEAPGINTNSSVFKQSFGHKASNMPKTNAMGDNNPFTASKNDNTQFPNMSPIKSGKVSDPETLRASDLEALNAPFGAPVSPIGQNSANRKFGSKTYRQATGGMSDPDEGADELIIRDSDDIIRGRDRLRDDKSPHDRNARPRSSIMKKEWAANQKDSELSSPKQVTFARGTKCHLEPQELEDKLRQEIRINDSRIKESNFSKENKVSYENDQPNQKKEHISVAESDYKERANFQNQSENVQEIDPHMKADYDRDYTFRDRKRHDKNDTNARQIDRGYHPHQIVESRNEYENSQRPEFGNGIKIRLSRDEDLVRENPHQLKSGYELAQEQDVKQVPVRRTKRRISIDQQYDYDKKVDYLSEYKERKKASLDTDQSLRMKVDSSHDYNRTSVERRNNETFRTQIDRENESNVQVHQPRMAESRRHRDIGREIISPKDGRQNEINPPKNDSFRIANYHKPTRRISSDELRFSGEVTREEFEEREDISSTVKNESYNFGKRLRSNERLSSREIELEREKIKPNPEPTMNKPQRSLMDNHTIENKIRKVHVEENPPTSFGMRSIINKQHKKQHFPENKDIENTVLPMTSSRLEESRNENSVFKTMDNSIRERSPFNMSNQSDMSYKKEIVQTRRSPQRMHRAMEDISDSYNREDIITTQRYPNSIPNEAHIQEEIYYPRGNSPRRIQEGFNQPRERGPEIVHKRVPQKPREIQYSSPARSTRKSPLRRDSSSIQEIEYTSPMRTSDRRQSPISRASPRSRPSPRRSPGRYQSPGPRQSSPRERPLGSPPRERKKHDPSTENNIISRFISNKMINKTVEDLVFELVPEFYEESMNPKRKDTKIPVKPSQRVSNAMTPIHGGKKYMSVVDTMVNEDDDSDICDTDEGINANRIVESMTKKETKNNYVKKREIDSLGIKFEAPKRIKGVKGLPYQDKDNYPMIDVRSRDTFDNPQICDVWCSECFDHITEGEEEKHLKICRPFTKTSETVDEDGNEIEDLPHVNEKIFKVSKAITQHLSDVMKTNAGIFDETVEIRFLRTLRQKAEDIEKNNKNLIAQGQMQDSINQITYDSKNNRDLHWVFVFSKRLGKLTGDKLEIMERIDQENKIKKQEIQQIRSTFIDKGSLRLTTIKDKASQSINYDEVKSVMMSPYRAKGETVVDSRFADLNIKKKNRTVKRINNSGSFSKLPI
ncbi:unnamed protein product [Moneuplotes crassus]|uniref:Uncharacterized protein n=1 Tax=Euplotes crassus TaxID=5936 RepID=A0AAD1UQU8_EUPCR|nr:unnamed protein product [Moneuplotes crassus]